MDGLDRCLALRAAGNVGLVRYDNQPEAGRLEPAQSVGHVRSDNGLLDIGGRAGLAVAHHGTVNHAVAIEEHRSTHMSGGGEAAGESVGNRYGALAHLSPASPLPYHFVADCLTAGWDTRRCQTTACIASACGVTFSGFTVGTITQMSATLAV